MKNTHILKGIFIAFLALQFFSCENESLEGEFPPRDDEQNDSTQVQFEALVNGERFVATSVTAKISEEDYLVMTGTKTSGEKITLKVADVDESTFRLTGAEGDSDVGLYYDRSGGEAYTTSEDLGGQGELSIDTLNVTTRRLSGTFKLRGVRPELDEMGNPVLDDNGDPVIEEVSITNGVFNNVAYEIGDDNGDPGGGNNDIHDFFAKVDGVEFTGESVVVTETVVAGNHMIIIEARNEDRDLIRIDIPRTLGEDTYSMERLSNGSMLIGTYKAFEEEVLTSDPGTLTITEFDKEQGVLVASFEFKARDPLGVDPSVVDITEGEMTIHFEGIPGGNNYFSAKVDDSRYLPESVLVDSEVIGQHRRFVVDTEIENQKMTLSFPQTVVEGNTYTMTQEATAGNEVVAIYTPEESGTRFSSESGEMTITLYDIENRIIEGVFQFIATDMTAGDPTEYDITEGSFRIFLP